MSGSLFPDKTAGIAGMAFARCRWLLLFFGSAAVMFGLNDEPAYATAAEVWADYDPRALPLETQIAKETIEDGVVLRTVYYSSEVTHGFKVRVVAYYGFPVGGRNLPAIMHLHGGGQNASAKYVKFFAQRGYACLSINWGGRPLEGKLENGVTDWGPLPYAQDAAHTGSVYNLAPNARSNSWYHWAIAGRRGLSFLEQQPEVDAGRIGMFGISMGGQLTWLIAGTDRRLRCAASVFGLALLYEPLPGIKDSEYVVSLRDKPAWRDTLDPIAYAPRIDCPFFYLSATNDIHGRMDMLDRTLRRVPAPHWQAYSLHMSHRLDVQEALDLEMWMDTWLKGGAPWPRSSELRVKLDRDAGAARASISPVTPEDVEKVTLHYSADSYPQSRFWRTVEPAQSGGEWSAPLPLASTAQGLQAFASVRYHSGLVLSTPLVLKDADELRAVKIEANDPPTHLIDDFTRGAGDWFMVDGDPAALLVEREYFQVVPATDGTPAGITWNPASGPNWKFFTRKVGDAKWRGPANSALRIRLFSAHSNGLVVILSRNHVRPPAKEQVYVATVQVKGGQPEDITLAAYDFKNVEDGSALPDWSEINLLGLAGRHVVSGKAKRRPDISLGGNWQGPAPVLSRVEWTEAK